MKRANELSCPVTLLLQLVPRSPRALEGGRRQEAGCRQAQSLPALAGAALGQANVPVVVLTDAGPDRGDKARGSWEPGPGGDPAEEPGGSARDPKGRFGKGTGEKAHQGLGKEPRHQGWRQDTLIFLFFTWVHPREVPIPTALSWFWPG